MKLTYLRRRRALPGDDCHMLVDEESIDPCRRVLEVCPYPSSGEATHYLWGRGIRQSGFLDYCNDPKQGRINGVTVAQFLEDPNTAMTLEVL